MFINIEKNLLIASLEAALQDARTSAGVTSLAEIESNMEGIRAVFTADPVTVTDHDIYMLYRQLQALQIPSTTNINRVFLRINPSQNQPGTILRGISIPESGMRFPTGGFIIL